jgi:hypothetical protein
MRRVSIGAACAVVLVYLCAVLGFSQTRGQVHPKRARLDLFIGVPALAPGTATTPGAVPGTIASLLPPVYTFTSPNAFFKCTAFWNVRAKLLMTACSFKGTSLPAWSFNPRMFEDISDQFVAITFGGITIRYEHLSKADPLRFTVGEIGLWSDAHSAAIIQGEVKIPY